MSLSLIIESSLNSSKTSNFRYNSNTPPTKEWLDRAIDVTDENIKELLKLIDEE
jgi:hypothetical protein